jgi:hypothetical protein
MFPTPRLRRRGQGYFASESGVALIEFALVLPFLLLIVLGVVDFGKALGYKNDETHLANQAARAAAVNACPGGCADIVAWIRNQAPNELQNGVGSVKTPGLQDAAAITFSFPNGNAKHCTGDSVKVVVKTTYKWLSYLVNGPLGSFGLDPETTIRSDATMRLEKNYVVGGTNAYSVPSASGTC